MKTTLLTIIILLISSFNSFACECLEYNLKELDNISYEASDLIVIGNVVKTGANYQIEVIEVLNGNIREKLIYGTTISEDGIIESCSSVPFDKGKYLFYLNRTEKNGQPFYLYSGCLGTRKLNLDFYPVSLKTEKSKTELITDTQNWINELRKKK
jgi:hypothetical protein